MHYDFDRFADRAGSASVKWSDSIMEDMNGRKGLLPLWVADMDFDCAKPIMEALTQTASSGIFGYAYRTDDYAEAVKGWFLRRHGWKMESDWIVYSPGVVTGINAVIQEFTLPGEKVIIQSPVYHPFAHSITNNGRAILDNRLIELGGGDYAMDFDDLEKKASDPLAKVILLCNPHNPVGKVWTGPELERLGEICVSNGVMVVSDEIHCDLVYKGNKHIPFSGIRDNFRDSCISCTAVGKTFNLAGLQMANLIISDPAKRKALERRMEANGIQEPTPFGLKAAIAAYSHGDEWLDQVLSYLEGNIGFMGSFIEEKVPEVTFRKPDGTYLAWLDFRALGLGNEGLARLITDVAGLALNHGYVFGEAGSGFERLNFACSRSTLEKALIGIERAVRQRISR